MGSQSIKNSLWYAELIFTNMNKDCKSHVDNARNHVKIDVSDGIPFLAVLVKSA